MATDKKRLDKFLADAGLSGSREKAQREIVSGWVKVNGETIREVSHNVFGNETVTVERPGGLFVSRGGEKLARALSVFAIDVKNCVCVDLGASTGGFTDCLLKNGAAHVYAVDVGYGQLDYALRSDSRVTVLERTNARNLSSGMFERKIDFISADLSFVSFVKVYRDMKNIFPGADGVALIKPQFEAEKSEHKKGVVTKPEIHREILERTLSALQAEGMNIHGLTYSPVKGPKGNIEFLLYFSGTKMQMNIFDVGAVVEEAHRELSSQ